MVQDIGYRVEDTGYMTQETEEMNTGMRKRD
jgi:hypothetical protein